MSDATPRNFDPERLFAMRFDGHGSALGIAYHAHGDDWAELALPYDPRLVGDMASGVLASGPVLALMDMATSVAVWRKARMFKPDRKSTRLNSSHS